MRNIVLVTILTLFGPCCLANGAFAEPLVEELSYCKVESMVNLSAIPSDKRAEEDEQYRYVTFSCSESESDDSDSIIDLEIANSGRLLLAISCASGSWGWGSHTCADDCASSARCVTGKLQLTWRNSPWITITTDCSCV